MTGESRRIFVYGTLKRGERFHQLLGPDCRVLDEGCLPGELFALPEGYPALVPGAGTVWGEICELPATVLATLDELEGYVPGEPTNLYRRSEEKVLGSDGQSWTCLVYWYNNEAEARRRGIFLAGGCWTEDSSS